MIAFSKKALSKLIKESRPRAAAGFGGAKQNRRRNATSNTIALTVASQPAVIHQQQAAKQALHGKHNNSKQQNRRYKANTTATATCPPVPPHACGECCRGSQGGSLVSTTSSRAPFRPAAGAWPRPRGVSMLIGEALCLASVTLPSANPAPCGRVADGVSSPL